MIIRTKWFAIQTACPAFAGWRHGITLCFGRKEAPRGSPQYAIIFHASWDRPRLIWAHKNWAINEPGCVRGLPIARHGTRLSRLNRLSRWTGCQYHVIGWSWPHYFSASGYD